MKKKGLWLLKNEDPNMYTQAKINFILKKKKKKKAKIYLKKCGPKKEISRFSDWGN